MKRNFKVIRGGLADLQNINNPKGETFKSAYVTDTRLMGVLSVGISWTMDGKNDSPEFHQFFYMDVEEYGLENYKSILSDDMDLYDDIQRELIGGLGGRIVSITLREAMWLIQKYARLSVTRGYNLPEPKGEYEFLLWPKINLTDPEMYILDNKQCKEVTTPFESMNYFLMRCFAKDFDAAAVLSTMPGVVSQFPNLPKGTLCKNTIKESSKANFFLCESLVEAEENYYITVTELEIERNLIKGCEGISNFNISYEEAALSLRQEEYVILYDFLDDYKKFDCHSTYLINKSTAHQEEVGKLFVLYKADNEHVNTMSYRLTDDYYGVYFITKQNELIAMANNPSDMNLLERDLELSPLASSLVPKERFRFHDPIIYDFIQSGLSDFRAYINVIRPSD